jgi:hypothetical protein
MRGPAGDIQAGPRALTFPANCGYKHSTKFLAQKELPP